MKHRIVIVALLAGACSPGTGGSGNAVAPEPRNTTAPVAGQESADARAAHDTAARYFDLLRAHDYSRAYRLWNGDGADTRGSLADFRQLFAGFTRYDGTAGAPSAIHSDERYRYALVEAKVQVVPRETGKPAEWDGTVMLKRPLASPVDGWRIWGTDIRPRRCKPTEQPRGLGCDPA